MISSWSERMISHTGTETRPRLLWEAAVGNFPQWAKSLTEQCHMEVEGLRVVNFFSQRRSNDVRHQISGLNPRQAVETTKLECGRGRGNFRWSGEMHRDQKEHQRQKHFAGLTLTLRDES
ncbi:unnamed protein product [Victoria cruziana]